MPENPSTVLSLSGYRAVIEPDRWSPGSFTLVVDGTPQSHVNVNDPTQLFFEYIQRIGHVIDQLPEGPITAHISPARTDRLMPCRISTSREPARYDFVTSTASISTGGAFCVGCAVFSELIRIRRW